MADTTGNTAVTEHGDHDRVAMLSLNADGTPNQHNPELIGERDAALAATRRQFTEQAVSAADVARRGATPAAAEPAVQDPTIAELQQAHDSAAAAAEQAAEQTVGALIGDEPAATTGGDPAAKRAAKRAITK